MARTFIIGFCIALAFLVFIQFYSNGQVIGGTNNPQLYPNAHLTPGKADTLSLTDLTKDWNGKTYSQAHRSVSSLEKKTVCSEYTQNCTGTVEIDHFYPLCAGGSNDLTNLWAEPEHVMVNGMDWGFHTKDRLEAYVCIQIKTGNINPQDAYKGITTDWIAYYNKVMPKNALGGTTQEDGDDL